MTIERWIRGCRVYVCDWVGKDSDGETPIRVGVEYFNPGASIYNPAWEESLICQRREGEKIRLYLDSVVAYMIERHFLKNQVEEKR